MWGTVCYIWCSVVLVFRHNSIDAQEPCSMIIERILSSNVRGWNFFEYMMICIDKISCFNLEKNYRARILLRTIKVDSLDANVRSTLNDIYPMWHRAISHIGYVYSPYDRNHFPCFIQTARPGYEPSKITLNLNKKVCSKTKALK